MFSHVKVKEFLIKISTAFFPFQKDSRIYFLQSFTIKLDHFSWLLPLLFVAKVFLFCMGHSSLFYLKFYYCLFFELVLVEFFLELLLFWPWFQQCFYSYFHYFLYFFQIIILFTDRNEISFKGTSKIIFCQNQCLQNLPKNPLTFFRYIFDLLLLLTFFLFFFFF